MIQLHSPFLAIDPSDSSDTLLVLYWHLTIQTNAGRHAVFQCLSISLSHVRDANVQECFQQACVLFSSTFFNLCANLSGIQLLAAMMSSRPYICLLVFFFKTHLLFVSNLSLLFFLIIVTPPPIFFCASPPCTPAQGPSHVSAGLRTDGPCIFW